MQIIRAVIWIVIFAILLVFTANNWRPVEVKVWEGLILETKTPALVIVAFLLGLVPMWLIHRGRTWQLNRRINGLESAARSAAASLSHASEEAQAAAAIEAAQSAPSESAEDSEPGTESKA